MADLLELLRDLEWSATDAEGCCACPDCGEQRAYGHARVCRVAVAMNRYAWRDAPDHEGDWWVRRPKARVSLLHVYRRADGSLYSLPPFEDSPVAHVDYPPGTRWARVYVPEAPTP